MDLIHDIKLSIAIGLSASSKKWKNTAMTWSALAEKLSIPVVTAETYKQYLSASREEQNRIKDVGGFVGGFLTGGKRDKSNVLYRQVIALDLDFSHDNFWWDFTMLFDCAAVIHSTHKSCKDKPRHRLIIPLSREVSQEEYQAIARKVAGDLNIDLFDKSTFDVNRLMFWPSVSSDAEYYFEYQDGPILDADYILGLYNDWHDTSEWPTATDMTDHVRAAISKQEDPTSKKGIVGMFCRAYTVQDAINEFLSDVYTQIEPNRYTYNNGTTAGGLVVYEDKFVYSHHGTDPIGGRLCNAFDLVRIHKFGHLDAGSKKDKDKDLPSFKQMEEFVSNDKRTKKQIAFEHFESAKNDFKEGSSKIQAHDSSDEEWVTKLEVNKQGEYTNSAYNIDLILKNDPLLKGLFQFNTFDNKRYVSRVLPWRTLDSGVYFRDVDYSGIRNYFERIYGIVASQKIDDSMYLEFESSSFHPVLQYLESLEWDGKKRVDTLLIDYFGADDTVYTRAAIRKTLCAAVARVMEPGIKFDTALILVGPQGTYKSTFVRKLGREWFSDSFLSVQGKESFEQIQGFWLIEIGELSALKKAEVETIKQYLSKCEDSFRPAYGRTVETYKRQCIFFGTTNNKDFLRDSTGNRRFMPVDVHVDRITKSVPKDMTDEEINQIWAEAVQLYKAGETLYLEGEEDRLAKVEQHKHSEVDDRRGLIEEYLNKLYPKDWASMDLQDRKHWLDDPLAKNGTEQKNEVCIAEIWCECLGRDKHDMSRYNTRDINDILKQFEDWEHSASTKNFPIYGKQKYYKRKADLL